MATIRDLMIRLGVDSNVEEGIGKATNALKGAEGKFRLAGAAIGGAVGATLTDGLMKSMSIEQANDKLAAQLGATGPQAERLGKVAGSLYAKGFGDDIGQVNEALKGVIQNISGMAKASDEELQKITGKVVNLAKTFDQDLGGTSRAVGKMLKTGLATDANEALDILTKGFQNGNDQAGDLLDTFSEYSTKFRDLGLSGQEAMGLIQQGLQGGARDADVVADSLKEFQLIMTGQGKPVRAALEGMGLNADDTFAAFAKGGDSAKGAFKEIMFIMNKVVEPADRGQLALALFGTKAEDMGQALYSLDPNTAVAGLGQVAGAADTMGKTLSDNATAKIDTMKRSFETMVQGMIGQTGPMGTVAAAVSAFGLSALSAGGDVAQIGTAAAGIAGKVGPAILSVLSGFGSMVAGAATATASVVASIATQVAKWVWLGVQALIQAGRVALAWVIAMGPIAIIIAAVIALVALIILNWDKIKNAIAVAWQWIKDATATVWGAIVNWLKGLWNGIVGTVTGIWTSITGAVSKGWQAIQNATATIWQGIKDAVKNAALFILNLFLNFTLPGLIAKHWDTIKNAAITAWNAVVGFIKTAVGKVVDAIGGIASIPGKVATWFGQVRQNAINKMSELISWLRQLPSQIVNAFGNIGATLANVGRNLVIGLWNGIINMVQWLYDKITGFFGGIVDWVKGALGIGSPSKEMAKLGKFSMQGFGNGILAMRTSVLRVASNVMDSVTGIFASPVALTASADLSGTSSGSATPSYGYAGTGMAGDGSGSIVIQNLSLTFADDRDMYQKGSDFADGLREYKRRGGVIPV